MLVQQTAGFTPLRPQSAQPSLSDHSPTELLSTLAAIVEAQTHLLGLLAKLLEPARSCAEPRAVLRDERLEPCEIVVEKEQVGQERHFLRPSTNLRTARAESPRGFARLDELLTPLHQLCRRLHLTPLNNRRGVAEALESLDDADVEELVRSVIRDSNGDVQVRSPFGLLVSRARRYEPGSASLEPASTAAIDTVDVVADIDDGLAEVIDRYERDPSCSGLLKSLDDQIAQELPILMRRDVPPAVIRALRADALRSQVVARERR